MNLSLDQRRPGGRVNETRTAAPDPIPSPRGCQMSLQPERRSLLSPAVGTGGPDAAKARYSRVPAYGAPESATVLVPLAAPGSVRSWDGDAAGRCERTVSRGRINR